MLTDSLCPRCERIGVPACPACRQQHAQPAPPKPLPKPRKPKTQTPTSFKDFQNAARPFIQAIEQFALLHDADDRPEILMVRTKLNGVLVDLKVLLMQMKKEQADAE